jgi:hypothetical protein
MPSGLSAGDVGVAAPTDLPGYGDIQWESMSGRDMSRAMVGGPTWGEDMTGFNPSTGFSRISTGEDISPPIPGQVGQMSSWKHALNWQASPTFWIMLFALAAVGFIHARVSLRAGPAALGGGLG